MPVEELQQLQPESTDPTFTTEISPTKTTGEISDVPMPDNPIYNQGTALEGRGERLEKIVDKGLKVKGYGEDYTPFFSELEFLAAKITDSINIPEQLKRAGRFLQRAGDPYDSNFFGQGEPGLRFIQKDLLPEAKEALTDVAGWVNPSMPAGAGIVKGWNSQLVNFLMKEERPRKAFEWAQLMQGAVKKPGTFTAEEFELSKLAPWIEQKVAENPNQKLSNTDLLEVFRQNELDFSTRTYPRQTPVQEGEEEIPDGISWFGRTLNLPRKPEETLEGNNYREYIFKQAGDEWSTEHFPKDKGLWGWIRGEERTLDTTGDRAFVVVEMQSDRIQEGSRKGWGIPKDSLDETVVPDAPFKKEENYFLVKSFLKQAKEEGKTKVAFPASIDVIGEVEKWRKLETIKVADKHLSQAYDEGAFDLDALLKAFPQAQLNNSRQGDIIRDNILIGELFNTIDEKGINGIKPFLKDPSTPLTHSIDWEMPRAKQLRPFYERDLPKFLKQFGEIKVDTVEGKFPMYVLDVSSPKAQKMIDNMTDYGKVLEQPHTSAGAMAAKSSAELTEKWKSKFLGTDPTKVPIFRAAVRLNGEVNLGPIERGAGGDYLSVHSKAKGWGEPGAEEGYKCPDGKFRTRVQMIPYLEREFGLVLTDPDAGMWRGGLERFTAEAVEDVLRKGKVREDIKEVGIKVKDADTGREYAEGGVVNKEEDTFDPSGSGYDYSTAIREALGVDDTGHWPSRAPISGQILKGRGHPTYGLTEQGEAAADYAIQTSGRGYSAPAFQRLDPGVYQDDAGNIFQVTKEGQLQPLGGNKFSASGLMSQ